MPTNTYSTWLANILTPLWKYCKQRERNAYTQIYALCQTQQNKLQNVKNALRHTLIFAKTKKNTDKKLKQTTRHILKQEATLILVGIYIERPARKIATTIPKRFKDKTPARPLWRLRLSATTKRRATLSVAVWSFFWVLCVIFVYLDILVQHAWVTNTRRQQQQQKAERDDTASRHRQAGKAAKVKEYIGGSKNWCWWRLCNNNDAINCLACKLNCLKI